MRWCEGLVPAERGLWAQGRARREGLGARGTCPPQALGWETRETTEARAVVRVYYAVIGVRRAGRCQRLGLENRSLVLRAVP